MSHDDGYGGAGPEHRLERLVFFSDAVFAIAITLLVIEIGVPHLDDRASDLQFVQALLNLIPKFVGFVVSFFVIGAFWAGHHRAFACASKWSPRLVGPNLQMLLAIAAMPFFTAFVSEYPMARVPNVTYAVWLLVTALLNIRLQRVATAPDVRDSHCDEAFVRLIRQRGLAVMLGAITAILVALFVPLKPLALVSLMSIPFWRRLLTRLDWA